MILKLYFIDRLETELSKSKIEEKLTEITAEDKFYSGTWEFAILFILWSFFSWIDVKMNIINFVCHCLFYILGIWIAKMHCTNICKKVVDILKKEL